MILMDFFLNLDLETIETPENEANFSKKPEFLYKSLRFSAFFLDLLTKIPDFHEKSSIKQLIFNRFHEISSQDFDHLKDEEKGLLMTSFSNLLFYEKSPIFHEKIIQSLRNFIRKNLGFSTLGILLENMKKNVEKSDFFNEIFSIFEDLEQNLEKSPENEIKRIRNKAFLVFPSEKSRLLLRNFIGFPANSFYIVLDFVLRKSPEESDIFTIETEDLRSFFSLSYNSENRSFIAKVKKY